MYFQEKKEQIFLRQGYNHVLSGKVIDKVSLHRDNSNCETGELLITFTDNTFILLSPQWEEERDTYVLQNEYIQPLNELSSKPGCVINDEFHWDGQFQRYVDCGIIEFDTNVIKEWIEKANKAKEQREFQEYLRLKRKFEK